MSPSHENGRIAVLFFGLLNTFEQINQDNTQYTSLYKALKNINVDVDAFFDTSPLAFLKVPVDFPSNMNSLAAKKLTRGRRLITRVSATASRTKDYLILEDPVMEIEARLKSIMGSDLVSLRFTEPEPNTWSGPHYIKNMINAFLHRKKCLIEDCTRYASQHGLRYDAVIIARPDSALKVRHNNLSALHDVSIALSEDLERAISGDLGVDHLPYNEAVSESGVHLFKNDILVSNLDYAPYVGSLLDVVESAGDYLSIYNRPAFRCEKCRALFREAGDQCPNCASLKPASVVSWPEYKTAEHISAGGRRFFVLNVTGDVVRK